MFITRFIALWVRHGLGCLAGWSVCAATHGIEPVDPAATTNPYRNNAEVLATGEAVFQANCAVCHGDHAIRPLAEAPDLRRLNSFCARLKDADLKQLCLKDVDAHFLHSVREGKVRAGVMYMPPWKDKLAPSDIWAVRSFIETRPQEPPHVTTSVDAARAAEAAGKRR